MSGIHRLPRFHFHINPYEKLFRRKHKKQFDTFEPLRYDSGKILVIIILLNWKNNLTDKLYSQNIRTEILMLGKRQNFSKNEEASETTCNHSYSRT